MWVILVLASCAVDQVRSVILQQEIGHVRVHAKARGPPLNAYLPLDQNDISASQSLMAYIEELKSKLSPVIRKGGEIATREFSLNEVSTEVNLKLSNYVLKGLRDISLHDLVIRMQNGRVDFNASAPFLSTTCTVFLNGVIDETHTYAIFGNLSVVAMDVSIAGTLNIKENVLPPSLRSTQSTVYQIEDADVTIDIEDLIVQFVLTEELQAFKMTLVKFMNKPVDDIIKSITGAVLLVVNEHLAKIQPADIKYLLLRRAGPPLLPQQLRGGAYLRSPNYRYNYWY